MYYSAEANASRFKYALAHHDGTPRDAGSVESRTTAPLALDPGAYTPPSRLGKLMATGGGEVTQWRVKSKGFRQTILELSKRSPEA